MATSTQKQNQSPENSQPGSPQRHFTGWQVGGIVLLTIFITLGISYWVISVYLFPESFAPVNLNPKEQQRLDRKLEALGVGSPKKAGHHSGEVLEPEPYSENAVRREVEFTEKEVNAVLAHNTDLARKLAIDLSEDMASAKLLVPLDPELPFLGGRTLKITAGLELAMEEGRPRAVLKGVSVWGVPLPNAWLGNLKNVDLVAEFGEAGGFWQALADGVEKIEVKEGKLRLKMEQ